MPSLSGSNNVKVTIDTQANTEGVDKTENALKRLSGTSESVSAKISAHTAAIAGAFAGMAQAVVGRAINVITDSIGDAITRVDTLNRFPIVMQNLGYAADDSSTQIKRMAKELIGLPTSLDHLATFVTRVAPVSSSLKGATDTALAFNNAVLAGGGPVYRQADAIEQFSQMLSKGKPDLMAWRTLQEAMPATLGQVAKGLGDASGNTQALYDKLLDGTISMKDFSDEIVNLNSTGLPGFKNFEQQAKDSTKGISTGIANMKTAVTRGLAAIMTAIGTARISEFISDIGKGFEGAEKSVAKAIPSIVEHIKQIWTMLDKLFGPSLLALWHTISEKLIPVLERWKPYLEFGAKVMGVVLFAAVWTLINVLNILINVISFVGQVMANIGEAFAWVWHHITGLWGGTPQFFTAIGHGIRDAFSAIVGWITAPFRNAYDIIYDLFAGLGGKLGSLVTGAMSKVAAPIKSALHTLHVPGFASGVHNFSGGLALVGEQGPELVDLPPGSNVHTNKESSEMMGGAGGTNITIQTLVLPGVTDRQSFIASLDQDTLLAGRGLTPNRGMM